MLRPRARLARWLARVSIKPAGNSRLRALWGSLSCVLGRGRRELLLTLSARANGTAAEYWDRLVRQVLEEEGPLGFEALRDRVAERAMREEQARGAWATDIALWGPGLYRREAAQAVRRMIGSSLVLRLDGPLPAMAPAGSAEPTIQPREPGRRISDSAPGEPPEQGKEPPRR